MGSQWPWHRGGQEKGRVMPGSLTAADEVRHRGGQEKGRVMPAASNLAKMLHLSSLVGIILVYVGFGAGLACLCFAGAAPRAFCARQQYQIFETGLQQCRARVKRNAEIA